ncbi:MAG: hypothetical protein QW208_04195 [Acidilobaceae archaeon]
MRVILIYHDPGLSEGFKLIDDLREDLARELNLEIVAYPISSIEDMSADIRSGDLVFSLIPFRGGHYAQIIEYTSSRGARLAGKIPTDIIAKSLVDYLRGCSKVTVLYWKAKRYIEEQLEDLNSICRFIENYLNVKVAISTGCSEYCDGCIVVSSLLPGRLTVEALGSGYDVRVPYLLATIRDLVVGWIKGYIVGFYNLKTS